MSYYNCFVVIYLCTNVPSLPKTLVRVVRKNRRRLALASKWYVGCITSPRKTFYEMKEQIHHHPNPETIKYRKGESRHDINQNIYCYVCSITEFE